MTPSWIDKNAYKVGPNAVVPGYFEIQPSTGRKYQRALRIPLVEPGVLRSSDSVTVTIESALDTTIPQNNDHDPIFGISDLDVFLGFQTLDVANFPNYSPCFCMEGTVGESILENRTKGGGSKTNSTHYSSKVTLQIKPDDQWGSCHIEQVDGLVNTQGYQSTINPLNGIYFEFYRHNAKETYRIKYIKISLEVDSC